MKNNIIIGILLILIIGITGCTTPKVSQPTTPVIISTSELSASQDLKQFKDINALKEFLSQQSTTQDNSRGGMMYDAAMTKSSLVSTSNSAPSAQATSGSSTDYSQTNVQIKSVDEADFVKNDGNYIYMIADNNLVIIDAKDGVNSKIISKTPLDIKQNYYSDVRDLFLNKDKIIIFTNTYEDTFYLEKYNIEPIQTQKQITNAKIYDVSDRTNPKVVEEFNISGSYYSSRMINNVIYIVSQEGMYNWQYYEGPMVKSSKISINPSIYYFDNQEQNYQMNTITSINIDSNEAIDSKSIMLGYSNTLMVSENNIYIAYQKQNYWCWGWRCSARDTDNRERFMTVVVPLLKGDIKTNIDSIISKKLSVDEEWTQISEEFNKFYTQLKNNETMQKNFEDNFNNIQDALNEYDTKKALEQSKTIIHRFSIDNGKIEYQAKGEVEGRLLNQFSLDEYQNNLRVATTTDIWLNLGGRVQYNNVFVLNDNLKTIGSLKNLAQNESIYSSRFIGDKLYLVTFRQIDPFFVIDLSNPKTPEVLGYLKIPGYSSYLHPIANNLIIGVGKDTTQNEYGGTITKGVKVSLFDVTDFNNPKEISKYEIGLEGTDSPILYDHKAFLYIENKNILVIPVTEITEKIKSGPYNYRTKLWNGAYVFNLSNNTFELTGKIKHSSSESEYYYWMNSATVTRSLYIGNTLYTISNEFVKANGLDSKLTDLNSINLPNNNANNNVVQVMY